MGRYKSLAKITGSWADIQLCADGTARNKSSLTKKKWRKSAKMKLSRESAKAFGGASASGGKIISQLPEEMRHLARGHAHNHIAAPLRRCIATTCIAPEAYTFEAALPALFRLDLSQNRILSPKVFIRTIGDPLQPTGIHIQGLRDAADAITPLPDHRLQFCLHFCFVEFPESRPRMDFKWYIYNEPRSHQQPSTGWLQAELIPESGITLALETPNPDEPQILFLAVEWRQVRNSSARKQRLRPSNQNPAQVHTQSASTLIQTRPERSEGTNEGPRSPKNATAKQAAEASKGYGILKIAALFRPTKDLDLPRPAFLRNTCNKKYRPTIKPRNKVNLTRMTPEQKLRVAMPTLGATNSLYHAPSKIGFVPAKHKKPKDHIGPLPHSEVQNQRPLPHQEAQNQGPVCQPSDHKASGLANKALPKIPAPPTVDESERHAATPVVDGPQYAATPVVHGPQYAATPVVDGQQHAATPEVDRPQYAVTPEEDRPQYAVTPEEDRSQYAATPEVDRPQYASTPEVDRHQYAATPEPDRHQTLPKSLPPLDQPYTTARQSLDYTYTKSTHSAHIHHIICTYPTFRTNGGAPIWKRNPPIRWTRFPQPSSNHSHLRSPPDPPPENIKPSP